MTDFLIDNLLLIGCVIVSAGGLIFGSVNQKRHGPTVGPAEATVLINRQYAQVVDLRKASDFKKGHIPNSVNYPADQIQNMLGKLKKDLPVILVDQTGNQFKAPAKLLRSVGFKEVYALEGGISEWQKSNRPLA